MVHIPENVLLVGVGLGIIDGMSTGDLFDTLDQHEANDISLRVAQVFTPRTPVSTRDLFAGRWKELTQLADAVSQTGLHVIIYGERGVGKTSLANIVKPLLHVFDKRDEVDDPDRGERLVVKVNAIDGDTFDTVWGRAIDEISWEEQGPQLGFRPQPGVTRVSLRAALQLPDTLGIDDVRRSIAALPGSVFIFDEYDRISDSAASTFTDLIKTCLDFSIESTMVVVGVAETIDQLMRNHASISRALTQIYLPRMTTKELGEIIEKGEKGLGMSFDKVASDHIVRMSHGLPHYTHLVAQFSVREACKEFVRTVETDHVERAFQAATEQALQTVKDKYDQAIQSSHRDSLYAHVLLACAMAATKTFDDLGQFQAADVQGPLRRILPEREITVSTYNKHLGQFCDEKRGCILERTGQQRSYKYRFHDPLVPPYVIMQGVTAGTLRDKNWLSMNGNS